MNIVFMGTPDFAVPCLERLIADGHTVSGVFTRADKPVGRKQILTPPPVKVCAMQHGIKVYQPERIKNNAEVLDTLTSLAPDVIVVVAYGRLLPQEVLDLPRLGCVNVHGSLLPRHRGASPIQWSIVCGDSKTGVTTMLMDIGMDTGDILHMCEIPILPTETAETLHDKMAAVGANLLSQTITELGEGCCTPIKQPDDGVSYAPIITKQMGLLDFSKPAPVLDCLIRGFTPWPSTYFCYNNRRYKVLRATPAACSAGLPGTVTYTAEKMFVTCGSGTSIEILQICPEGGKSMDAAAFINGRFIEAGSVIIA